MAEAKPKRPAKEEGIEDGDLDDDAPIAASKPKPKYKPVKKEEPKEEDDDDERPLAPSKLKKRTPGHASKVKKEHEKPLKGKSLKSNVKRSKLKTGEAGDSEEENAEKNKKKKKVNKKEEEKKLVKKAKQKEKKEKKVYDLPGQKHDQPEERDPLRIFYETLYQQLPESEMAAFWMMEWGLLPLNEAKKVYERKLKKQQQQKLGSPVKMVSAKTTTKISVKKSEKVTMKTVMKTKKRKVNNSSSDSDIDDNFIFSKKKKQKASS